MVIRELSAERQRETHIVGTWFAAVGMPTVVLAAAVEVWLLARPQLAVWKALPFVTFAVFLLLRRLAVSRRVFVAAHAMSVAAAATAAAGTMAVVLRDPIAPLRLRYATVAILFCAVFVAYLAAAGARRWIPLLIGVPTLCAVIDVAIRGSLTAADWVVMANPLLALVGVSVLSVTTDAHRVREFVASRAAFRRKRELTEEHARLKREMSERQRLEQELRTLATRDDLTGVLNRRAGLELLEQYIDTANETARPLTVVLLDIDRLKSTNDQLGHPAGDAVLRSVARLLRQQIRSDDYVTRIGGDEFVVAFENCTQRQAIAVVERTRLLLQSDERTNEIDFSYGCFEYVPNSGLTADELLRIADSRMGEFKRLKSGNTE